MAINYIEKGYTLHNEINKLGYSLVQKDGVWVADDEVAVQAIIDGFDPLDHQENLGPVGFEYMVISTGLQDDIDATVAALTVSAPELAFEIRAELKRPSKRLDAVLAFMDQAAAVNAPGLTLPTKQSVKEAWASALEKFGANDKG